MLTVLSLTLRRRECGSSSNELCLPYLRGGGGGGNPYIFQLFFKLINFLNIYCSYRYIEIVFQILMYL